MIRHQHQSTISPQQNYNIPPFISNQIPHNPTIRPVAPELQPDPIIQAIPRLPQNALLSTFLYHKILPPLNTPPGRSNHPRDVEPFLDQVQHIRTRHGPEFQAPMPILAANGLLEHGWFLFSTYEGYYLWHYWKLLKRFVGGGGLEEVLGTAGDGAWESDEGVGGYELGA